MADAAFEVEEIRFIIEPEQTRVHVFCRAIGDCPVSVTGWHFKAYPKSKSVREIAEGLFLTDVDHPLFWPQGAP